MGMRQLSHDYDIVTYWNKTIKSWAWFDNAWEHDNWVTDTSLVRCENEIIKSQARLNKEYDWDIESWAWLRNTWVWDH